jgi:topoisomerase-4 subunit B
MRPIIEAGNLYVTDSPLFVGKLPDRHIYADTLRQLRKRLSWSKEEFQKAIDSHKLQVSRFKGLGESSVEELKEYLTDPSTRRLLRVVIKGEKDYKLIEEIMGNSVEVRKRLMRISVQH